MTEMITLPVVGDAKSHNYSHLTEPHTHPGFSLLLVQYEVALSSAVLHHVIK